MEQPTSQPEPTSRRPIKLLISVGVFTLFFVLLLVAIAAIVGNRGGKVELEYDFSSPEAFLADINQEIAASGNITNFKNLPESVKFPEGVESFDVKMNMAVKATATESFNFNLEGVITKQESILAADLKGSLSGKIPNLDLTKPLEMEAKLIGTDVYFRATDFSSLSSEIAAPLAMIGITPGKWLKLSMEDYLNEMAPIAYPDDITKKPIVVKAEKADKLSKDGISYECLKITFDEDVIPSSVSDFRFCADSGKYYPVYYVFKMQDPSSPASIEVTMEINALRESKSVAKPDDAVDLSSIAKNQISTANDAAVRENAQTILNAINLYQADNMGTPPRTLGKTLPLVTHSDIFEKGVMASSLDADLVPTYIVSIPRNPVGGEYYVGVAANGNIVVAGKLSNGQSFVVER